MPSLVPRDGGADLAQLLVAITAGMMGGVAVGHLGMANSNIYSFPLFARVWLQQL